MDRETERNVIDLINRYINTVDTMRKDGTSGGIFLPNQGGTTLSKIDAFNKMANTLGNELATLLPQMNYAEWVGFSELVSSHVALLQMTRSRSN